MSLLHPDDFDFEKDPVRLWCEELHFNGNVICSTSPNGVTHFSHDALYYLTLPNDNFEFFYSDKLESLLPSDSIQSKMKSGYNYGDIGVMTSVKYLESCVSTRGGMLSKLEIRDDNVFFVDGFVYEGELFKLMKWKAVNLFRKVDIVNFKREQVKKFNGFMKKHIFLF
jgi:hypothetical protein